MIITEQPQNHHQHQQQHLHQNPNNQSQHILYNNIVIPIAEVNNQQQQHQQQQLPQQQQHQHQQLHYHQQDRLAEDDCEIVDTCNRLFEQTFEKSTLANKRNNMDSGMENDRYDYDEFTQVGIKKCVKFCMNLPGNNDLCTDDRAKLLKYGVYEIAVKIKILSYLILSLFQF